MQKVTTNWIALPGSYERRAVVTGGDTILAAALYDLMTTHGMSLDKKIERAIAVHRLGSSYTHEYRVKETAEA